MKRALLSSSLVLSVFAFLSPGAVFAADPKPPSVLESEDAEFRVRRSADQLADTLIRMQSISNIENAGQQIQELQKMGEEHLRQGQSTAGSRNVRNGYFFLDNDHTWWALIPYWVGFGMGLAYLPHGDPSAVVGAVGASAGVIGMFFHSIFKAPDGNGKSEYYGRAVKKSRQILEAAFRDQLRRRGIPVPHADMEEWLKRIIQGHIAEMVLVRSPANMAREIGRLRGLLQTWAEIMDRKGQPARRDVLLGLKKALPSPASPMRFLRPTAWMEEAFKSRRECIDAIRSYADRLELRSAEFNLEEALNPVLQGLERTSPSLHHVLEPVDQISGITLAKLGESIVEGSIKDLADTIRETKGSIQFQVEFKTHGAVSRISPTALAEATVKFVLNDGIKFNIENPGGYRDLAQIPLKNHSLNFTFEFATTAIGNEAIVEEGRWMKGFSDQLSAAIANDSLIQSRLSAAQRQRGVRGGVRVTATECASSLSDSLEEQEQGRTQAQESNAPGQQAAGRPRL